MYHIMYINHLNVTFMIHYSNMNLPNPS
jgi:hypothetical protein